MKTRQKMRLSFLRDGLIIFTILLSLNSCSHKHGQPEGATAEFPLGKIEIQGLNGAACGAPGYIAKEKGFFAAEGLDVTLVSGTFETNKTGLASGKFPVAIGDFQFFPSINEGLQIKLIAGLHQGCIKLVVPPGSKIKTAKDLAGKRIGVDEIGGTPMAISSVYLANAGIDPKTGVNWLAYPVELLQKVAEKGEVDAVALWDPFGTLAEKKGYTVLCDIGKHPLFAGRYCCCLYASAEQLKDYPERIKAILRAYNKASEWIATHPEETAKLIIKKKYISSDDPELITELIKSYQYHSHHNASTPLKAKEDALYFTDQLKKKGFLPKNIDTQKFVDGFYYELPVEQSKTAHQTMVAGGHGM
ncbi:MAG: ABC transporter substrate-binding protein [Bacteroidota bacterium]|nr:ABC transporter substrate-binding protein [Bacteroidota bacterium]